MLEWLKQLVCRHYYVERGRTKHMAFTAVGPERLIFWERGHEYCLKCRKYRRGKKYES
ncbi:hypothetical protein FIU93_23065 [Labrenzia sp. THAF35]|nr:hypothetical protein FIU93_23065 [Labrenzia sp. THAF35]